MTADVTVVGTTLASRSMIMPDVPQFESYARLLRLTPVDEAGVSVHRAEETHARALRRSRRPKGIVSFLALVVMPVCLVAGYFWLIAVDRYESEARFVLRMPGQTIPASQMANLLQGSGIGRANDGYVIQEFLESRDAMISLEKNSELRGAYAKAKADPVWQFPNLIGTETQEELYRHYKRLMSVKFDAQTGVSVLKMQAFAPEDTQRLTNALLDSAEELVNRLNDRARVDSIKLAQFEVEQMRQRALNAQAQLTVFRERERLVDPSQSTMSILETVAKLSLEAAQVNVQINELGKSSPNAPQINALRTRRGALEAQIVAERRRLAGDAQSIAPRIAEYERLMLEREFAEKALFAAMTSLELARVEAMRHQVYLERVVAPSLPDYPEYPWRIVWCLVALLAGVMFWRMWRTLATDALQHVKP